MRWKLWPFTEQRQNFTDLLTSAFVKSAEVSTVAALGLGSLETACNLYSRAFAGARVEGSDMVKEAVTPTVLSYLGRHLIRRGEVVFLIDVEHGEVVLHPVGQHTVTGGGPESEWRYQISVFGPSESPTRWVGSEQVVHCRYAVELSRSWQGLGPLAWCSETSALAAALEVRLKQECGSVMGFLLPAPLNPKQGSAAQKLQQDIAKLAGETTLVESQASGWGTGRVNSPRKDWGSLRLGADPPPTLQGLRMDVNRAVLGVCGVPLELVEGSGSGQASRESYRRFINLSVKPLAKVVEHELSMKLEETVTLNFSALQSHDLTGRASAWLKLVQGGMSPADATATVELEDIYHAE